MYEIESNDLSNGFVESVVKKGEGAIHGIVVKRRSLSDERDFTYHMEKIVTPIIQQLPKNSGIHCSTVDHLLAIFQPDGKCKVYVNELKLIYQARAKTALPKGKVTTRDDFADVESLNFEGIEIPDDAGVVVVLSHQWRKALFFDFWPIWGSKEKRSFDISEELGKCLNLLFFQHIHKMTEHQLDVLFSQQWFPFTGLKHATIESMISRVDSGWDCDDLLDTIVAEVKAKLPEWLKTWQSRAAFKDHMEIISRAAKQFMEKDYISSISILYPRIEGVLRSIGENPGRGRLTQSALSKIALKETSDSIRATSPILPEKFSEYLQKVFFADFKQGEVSPMSRNALAHGAARQENFSVKEATIGFLILVQIFYHLPVIKQD